MTKQSAPVSSIRNLGPASDEAFARAGITTADQLHALGPDKAYAKLLAAGSRPHFIGYYAMVMGLQGRPWNDCKGDEKKALRVRFDAIKAGAASDTTAAPAGIERILDQIGVGTKRQT
ncbi:MAG: TfoX/Sxy family DNA transformation protein [Pacificibacter sp.]|uniref:TfoX/Sxy family DNA transformation protein n=1 Tax=Pacificibacter sp. TaxID=1917866 RepID=UPI00321AB7CA